MFLTRAELAELTGYQLPAWQARWHGYVVSVKPCILLKNQHKIQHSCGL